MWYENPLAPVALILCSLATLGLTALVVYHFKLSSFNQTTYEQRKDTYTFYEWAPYLKPDWLDNLRARIFVKKPKVPIFDPFEMFTPGISSYKAPEKTTPPSEDYTNSQMITENSRPVETNPEYVPRITE